MKALLRSLEQTSSPFGEKSFKESLNFPTHGTPSVQFLEIISHFVRRVSKQEEEMKLVTH